MTPAAFEPAIPANKRPQTHVLDRAATGIGHTKIYTQNKIKLAKLGGKENTHFSKAYI